jgi:DNA primase
VVPGGEVVGFSARVVGEPPAGQDPPPKYVNSPESTVYKKSRLLFGLHQAREAFRAKSRAVLVEGNFDVISMHQAGFTETVAPLGTALTAEQIEQIRRLADKVVVFYDGDRAGYRATHAALELCFAAELPAFIARRPGSASSGGAGQLADGADPDTVVHAGGTERLAEMLDRALPAMEFMAYEVWSMARTPEAKARAIDDAAKLLAKVASATTRDLLTGTLASAMKLDPGVVQRSLARASRGERSDAPQARTLADSAKPPNRDELDLVCLLVDHPSLLPSAEEHGVLSLLTDERLRAMYSASLAGASISDGPPQMAELVLAGRFAQHPDPLRQLAQMVEGLRARHSELAHKELERRLAEARRSGDRELERSLVREVLLNRKQVD